MKKLYVLVFLIMFMGKIFSSTMIQISSQEEETFTVPSIAYYDNSNQYIFKKNGDVTITLPSNAYETITSGGGTIGGGSGSGSRKESITTVTTLKPKIQAAIRAKLEFYKKSFYELNEFFKANSIKMPTLTLSDLKGNPWDTLAPRVFAKKFSSIGITEPALKSIGLSNWIREAILRGKPLTLEQRFTIRLQKALIEKISGIKDVTNIMEPLRVLLLANSKIPDGPGKKTITEIFNFISPDIKAAVIKEIMKNLATVNLDGDGNVINKQNTLAELVLEKITDSHYREALVEMAQSLKAQDGDGLSRVVALNEKTILERLIDNPQKAFDLNEETQYLRKLVLNENTEESAKPVFVKVKLAELAPKTIAKVEKKAAAKVAEAAAKEAKDKIEDDILTASKTFNDARRAAAEAGIKADVKKEIKKRAQEEADRSAEAKKQRGKVITDNILNQGYNQTDDVNDKSKQEALAKAIAEHEAAQQAKIRADSAHEVAQEALTKAKGEHDAALQRLREAQQREVESPR